MQLLKLIKQYKTYKCIIFQHKFLYAFRDKRFWPDGKPHMYHLLYHMVTGKVTFSQSILGQPTNDSPTGQGQCCMVEVLGPQSAAAGVLEKCGQQ
jgi:hypothetical protein